MISIHCQMVLVLKIFVTSFLLVDFMVIFYFCMRFTVKNLLSNKLFKNKDLTLAISYQQKMTDEKPTEQVDPDVPMSTW